MPSAKRSNGYPLQGGQLSDQSNLLSRGTQPPTSLGFANSRHPVNLRKDHHLGCHERWDSGRQHQREILWQYLADKDKRRSASIPVWFTTALTLLLLAPMAFFAVNHGLPMADPESKEALQK